MELLVAPDTAAVEKVEITIHPEPNHLAEHLLAPSQYHHVVSPVKADTVAVLTEDVDGVAVEAALVMSAVKEAVAGLAPVLQTAPAVKEGPAM
jgi:hypothetical protein